jgi:hypothetical protein
VTTKIRYIEKNPPQDLASLARVWGVTHLAIRAAPSTPFFQGRVGTGTDPVALPRKGGILEFPILRSLELPFVNINVLVTEMPKVCHPILKSKPSPKSIIFSQEDLEVRDAIPLRLDRLAAVFPWPGRGGAAASLANRKGIASLTSRSSWEKIMLFGEGLLFNIGWQTFGISVTKTLMFTKGNSRERKIGNSRIPPFRGRATGSVPVPTRPWKKGVEGAALIARCVTPHTLASEAKSWGGFFSIYLILVVTKKNLT